MLIATGRQDPAPPAIPARVVLNDAPVARVASPISVAPVATNAPVALVTSSAPTLQRVCRTPIIAQPRYESYHPYGVYRGSQ